MGWNILKMLGNVRSVKLLRMKTKSANTTVNDDFADVFDNTFMKKEAHTPNKTTDPFESTYTEQQTSAARETIKVSKAKRMDR